MALVKGKAARPALSGTIPGGSCEQWTAELGSADASVRRQAAREMLHCADAGAMLIDRLMREQDLSVREAILTALVQLDDPAVVRELAGCLGSEDSALRNEVIEALRDLAASEDRADALPPVLKSLLDDPDPDLRIFAVNILESARYPDLERWLLCMPELPQRS